jgi:predicted transcriptional regulator
MTTGSGEVRIETDSLGEVAVPARMHWGAQTQRSIVNFPIGGETMPPALVRALGIQKLAAAKANMKLGVLDATLGEAQALMQANRISGIPVVDSGGKLVGIFTTTDACRALYRILRERHPDPGPDQVA